MRRHIIAIVLLVGGSLTAPPAWVDDTGIAAVEELLDSRYAGVIHPGGWGGQRTADQQDDRNDVTAHINSPQESEVSSSPGCPTAQSPAFTVYFRPA